MDRRHSGVHIKMAVNLNSSFASNSDAPTTAYPLGVPRNVSAPGAGDGTPWHATLIQDYMGLLQSLLSVTGITASNSPDQLGASQYLQALNTLMLGQAHMYTDSGSANTYVFGMASPLDNLDQPTALFDGMKVRGRIANSNTGASTLNVSGLGAVNISGTSTPGVLAQDDIVEFTYDSTANEWIYTTASPPSITVQEGVPGFIRLASNWKISLQRFTSTADGDEVFAWDAALAFTSQCYGVIIVREQANVGFPIGVTARSATTFTLNRIDDISGSVGFLAIGFGN